VSDVAAVELAVADAHRREWARVIATTMRVAHLGMMALAEECVTPSASAPRPSKMHPRKVEVVYAGPRWEDALFCHHSSFICSEETFRLTAPED
jgi:hypothetical protein